MTAFFEDGTPIPAEPVVRHLPSSTTSWKPVDLTEHVQPGYQPPRPTVGKRSDGVGVLYAGRTHSMFGETESAKTWTAGYLGMQELDAGNGVLFVDFEDDAATVTRRMMTLGALPAQLLDRFGYISPTEPVTAPNSHRALLDALGDLRPSVVVIDGVTEGMALHGLSLLDNSEVAQFGRLLIRPMTDAGAAVVSLDHVTKNVEGRGRYAMGAAHKLNGITGAAFAIENVHRFGDGLAGRSRLLISKDRPGQLRGQSLKGTGDRYWFADFTLDTREADPGDLVAPGEHAAVPFRPTTLMQKISEAIQAAPHPLTTNDVTARVQGKAAAIRTALACLVDEGFVHVTEGPRGARHHTHLRPYDEAES